MFHEESLPEEFYIARDLIYGKLDSNKRPYIFKRNETEGR